MEDQILERKCKKFCESRGYEYEEMEICYWTELQPDEDEIPSLVESIAFWKQTRPKGDRSKWTELQHKLEIEAIKKEDICTDLLARIPVMKQICEYHIKGEERKLRKLVNKYPALKARFIPKVYE